MCRDDPFVHDAGCYKCPDEFQEPFVFYPSRHACHEHVVIDGIKELFEIDVHNIFIPGLYMLPGFRYCLMGASARPEAVA